MSNPFSNRLLYNSLRQCRSHVLLGRNHRTPLWLPKCIPCEQRCFRTIYQREDPRHVDVAEQRLAHTLNKAFESLDCEGLPRFSTSRAQSTLAAPSLKVESEVHLGKQFPRTVAPKLRRQYAGRFYERTQQAVENAHLDRFKTCSVKREKNIKKFSYQ